MTTAQIQEFYDNSFYNALFAKVIHEIEVGYIRCGDELVNHVAPCQIRCLWKKVLCPDDVQFTGATPILDVANAIVAKIRGTRTNICADYCSIADGCIAPDNLATELDVEDPEDVEDPIPAP